MTDGNLADLAEARAERALSGLAERLRPALGAMADLETELARLGLPPAGRRAFRAAFVDALATAVESRCATGRQPLPAHH